MSIMTPPALCNHFPIDNPIVDITTSSERIAALDNATNQVLVVIHAAFGPSAYDRYVAHSTPTSDVNTMTYSQRFQASRKPTVLVSRARPLDMSALERHQSVGDTSTTAADGR